MRTHTYCCNHLIHPYYWLGCYQTTINRMRIQTYCCNHLIHLFYCLGCCQSVTKHILIHTYCCNHLILLHYCLSCCQTPWVTNTVPASTHTEGHIHFRPRLIAYPSWGKRSYSFSSTTRRFYVVFYLFTVRHSWMSTMCLRKTFASGGGSLFEIKLIKCNKKPFIKTLY